MYFYTIFLLFYLQFMKKKRPMENIFNGGSKKVIHAALSKIGIDVNEKIDFVRVHFCLILQSIY